MLEKGIPKRQVYETCVQPYSDMTFKSFDKKRFAWKRKLTMDQERLDAANLAFKFTPHASTVQVNGKGEVVQAWIKQHVNDQIEQLLAAIKDNTKPVSVEPMYCSQSSGMLEIPLYDNDSIAKGVTTKGTLIEKVDLRKAWLDAKEFYFNLIDHALMCANEVEVIYSPGNHDKTVGWLFAQMLQVRYGNIVDDSVRERKCIWWNGCFIGITHGDKGNDTAAGLRGKFTMDFPALFAAATVREIHVGHLHRESDSRDEYGAQIRRICTKGKTDEWTDEQGYMSQKRFMLFEWVPGRLKSIHYV